MNSKTTTEQLLNELNSLKEPNEVLETYLSTHEDILRHESLSDYLNSLLKSKNVDLNIYVKQCGVPSSYAYNIFSGKRKHPDKYKLLPICMTLGLNYHETNRALLLAEQPQLSPRLSRDAAIILCLNQQITDIHDINTIMYNHNQEPFIQ